MQKKDNSQLAQNQQYDKQSTADLSFKGVIQDITVGLSYKLTVLTSLPA
jgi:hypothetical protein